MRHYKAETPVSGSYWITRADKIEIYFFFYFNNNMMLKMSTDVYYGKHLQISKHIEKKITTDASIQETCILYILVESPFLQNLNASYMEANSEI